MAQLKEHTRWVIRRSKLVVSPADRAAVDAAATSGADAVVLDLVQAASPEEKVALRQEATRAVGRLANRGMDILAWVSVSTVGDDVASCARPGLTGVLTSADMEEDVWTVERALAAQETAQGIPVGTLQMELVVSSPRAVLDLPAIAGASPRITCLNMETSKLAAALGVEESGQVDQFLYARGRLLLVARLSGMEAHALAFVPLGEKGQPASLEARARLANKMGYRGALCWHAVEVPALNAAFGPSADELRYAREAKEAMEEAIRQGKGAATLRTGAILDIAMLRHSEVLLSWADAIDRRERAKAGRA